MHTHTATHAAVGTAAAELVAVAATGGGPAQAAICRAGVAIRKTGLVSTAEIAESRVGWAPK